MIRKGFDYDLGYTCFLLTEISDLTNNSLNETIKYFDYNKLKGIYDSACVFHCEDPVCVANRFIDYLKIEKGNFNRNKKRPTSIEMGDILGRLIFDLRTERKIEDLLSGVLEVLNDENFMDKLQNDSTDLYWQSAEVIFDYYTEGDLSWLSM